ncbi:unnamed protein product [Calicophoron daubneyi]|uniref:Uncharacterized protein n=1 Tax=Calicophoron daubneyi TaxID=300641 RepID=A0AAV2T5T3_CALDB
MAAMYNHLRSSSGPKSVTSTHVSSAFSKLPVCASVYSIFCYRLRRRKANKNAQKKKLVLPPYVYDPVKLIYIHSCIFIIPVPCNCTSAPSIPHGLDVFNPHLLHNSYSSVTEYEFTFSPRVSDFSFFHPQFDLIYL